MALRQLAMLVVLTGCDVVFSTPFQADDEPVRDAAVDAIEPPQRKCSAEADERLCIMFDDDEDALARDGSSFENHAMLANVTRIERAPGEGAVEVTNVSEIAIRIDSGLDLPGPLTWAMWVFSSTGQNDPAVAFDNHAQFAIAVSAAITPHTIQCVFTAANTQNPIVASAPLAPDRWYHVACVKDAGGLRLFLDGAFAKDNTSAEAMGPVSGANAEPVRIGQDSAPGNIAGSRLIGRVDDVYVLARALDPAEVFALAQR